MSSSPRISFSTELRDGKNSIPRSPSVPDDPQDHRAYDSESKAAERKSMKMSTEEFEFLSGGLTNMIAADELFCEGKLLPFRETQQSDHCKLDKISIKTEDLEKTEQMNRESNRISWFLDDDPSPRPPTCTVLWKELLRLRKQRASTLSPSSSSSVEMCKNKEKVAVKRTRSASRIRIRPVIHVAVCTQGKKGKLESSK